jgi:flagellar biogenesis protein FliO
MRSAFPVPAEEASPVLGQGPDLTRYLLVCALAIGLVLLAAALFRRFAAQHLRARAARRSLQVLDVLPLGGKQKLLVVRCYDRSFLLGLGEKEVRSLAELDLELGPVPLAPASAPARGAASAGRAGFPSFLRRELAPRAPAPEDSRAHERSVGRGTAIPEEGIVA